MKKTLTLLSLFFILACNSDDDDNSNPEFVEAVSGWYRLSEAYTDEALDLNQNGELSANLFDWNHYCGGAYLLESYFVIIQERFLDDISFDIPFSGKDQNLNQSYCIRNLSSGYPIEVNEIEETLVMIQDDYWDDFHQTHFHARVIDIVWEKEVIYITLEKEFYQANGEWIETILYMTFEKEYFEDEN